jgi:hypothetical protein
MGVELCNNTKSLYGFVQSTSDVAYYLYSKDRATLEELNLSDKSVHNKQYLMSLAQQWDSVFKKYNLKYIPGSVMTKVAISKGLWNERTFFYYDKNSNKPIQILQLEIFFEGDNAESEKVNPKIKKISLRFGKAMVNRSKFLLNQKPIDSPPLLEPANQ